MGIGYQMIDRHVIDYDLWFLDWNGPALRGPPQDLTQIDWSRAICCVGAAQTFGRFAADPYPAQIGRLLHRPVLNLGFSGAGPEFYLHKPSIMELLREANIVIIQAMSARSVSAGAFRALGNNGVLELLEGSHKGKQQLAQPAYAEFRQLYGEVAFQEQVAKVQARWVELHRELVGQIKGRRYFLWMSADRPGANVRLEKSSVGAFPHFVTAEMLATIEPLFEDILECVLPNMPPQVLVNDLTGVVESVFDKVRFPSRKEETRSLNTYYATPDLHDLAANLIYKSLTSGDSIGALKKKES